MNLLAALERDFSEHLAGVSPPSRIPDQSDDARARQREATPVPQWHNNEGVEL